MNLLLDTHVVLWWLDDPNLLSQQTMVAIVSKLRYKEGYRAACSKSLVMSNPRLNMSLTNKVVENVSLIFFGITVFLVAQTFSLCF